MFLRKTLLVWLLFLTVTVYGDSCTSPTATLNLNTILDNQKINAPVNVGGSVLFYKISLPFEGKLTLRTNVDEQHPTDTVDTYVKLLDTTCKEIADGKLLASNPRVIKIEKSLKAGEYYLKVYNASLANDGDVAYSMGYFQIENSFVSNKTQKAITTWRTSSSSVIHSGEGVQEYFYIKNSGTEAIEELNITIENYQPDHYLSFVSNLSSKWSCTNLSSSLVCHYEGGSLPKKKTISLQLQYSSSYQSSDQTVGNRAIFKAGYKDSTSLESIKKRNITILKALPGIKISKSAPDSVVQGSRFVCEIVVENNGTLVDKDVVVSDVIGSDFSFLSLEYDNRLWQSCSYDSSDRKVRCLLTNPLGVGERRFFKIHLKAVGDPGFSENISYAVMVHAQTEMGEVEDSVSKRVKIVAPVYVLDLVKRGDREAVMLGHQAAFYLEVFNKSNVPLSDVKVMDEVPSFFRVLALSDTSGWDCSSSDLSQNHVSCTLKDSLKKGEKRGFYIDVEGKRVALKVQNSAIAISKETPTEVKASDSMDIVPQNPSMRLTKYAPSLVEVGELFYYRFALYNDGSEVLSDINLTDSLDSRWIIPTDWDRAIGRDWRCTLRSHRLQCRYTKTMEPGEKRALYLRIRAPYVEKETTIDNLATLQSDKITTKSNTTHTTIEAPRLGVGIDKRVSASTVFSGERFYYTLVAQNRASLREENITIVDDLPEAFEGNATILPFSDSGWDCSKSYARHIECHRDVLEVGERKRVYIGVEAPVVEREKVVHNEATIHAIAVAKGMSGIALTNKGGVDVAILPPLSQMKITLYSSQSVAMEEDIFSYLLKVENSALRQEYNLTIQEHIPDDLTILSLSAPGWSCTQVKNLITCDLPTLAGKMQAKDINITLKAPSLIAEKKRITNQATLRWAGSASSLEAEAKMNLLPGSKALTLDLKSQPSLVYGGELYRYEIFLSNNSAKEIDEVNLTDTLPPGVLYDHYESEGWSCGYEERSRLFHCQNGSEKFRAGEKKIFLYVKAPFKESNVTNGVQVQTSLSSQVYEANTTTQVVGKSAKLSFSKLQSDKNRVKAGENFIYTVVVENEGGDVAHEINATQLRVDFELDSNTTLKVLHATNWSCQQQEQNISCLYTEALAPYRTTLPIDLVVSRLVSGQAIAHVKTYANETKEKREGVLYVDVKEVVESDLSLTLQESLDPVNANDSYRYDVTVSNPNETKSVEEVAVEINTTSRDDYDLIDFRDATLWQCDKQKRLLRCVMQSPLAPKSDAVLKLNVLAPNKSTTVEINATLFSAFVKDENKENNYASERTRIVDDNLSANNVRDFMKVPILGAEDTNIFGDILSIGNQLICEQSAPNRCKEPSFKINDVVDQRYVNLDRDYGGNHQSATSARLPIEEDDEILFAGLYWMGRIDKSQSGYQSKMKSAHKLFFRHESDTLYQTVFAQREAMAIDNQGNRLFVDKFNYINSNTYFDYQGMADVTEYVKAHRGGRYWVADVQSSEGYNLSSGWNLVVVVRDTKRVPTRGLKNITLFDGFQGVWTLDESYPKEVTQTISGFLTPATGLIDSSLTMFGFEGDAGFEDYIKIGDKEGTLQTLFNAKNAKEDIMNGTISKDGVIVSERAPALENTLGVDIDRFYLGDIDGKEGSGIIQNGQTSTQITIGSNGDRFFLGMFAFSTSLYDPVCYNQKIMLPDFSEEVPSQVHIGDEIGFEVEFRNKETQNLYAFEAVMGIDPILEEDNSTFLLRNLDRNGNLEAGFRRRERLMEFSSLEGRDVNRTEVRIKAGVDATAIEGGVLGGGKSIHVRYRARVRHRYDANKTHNIFSAIYAPSYKKVMIPPCSPQQEFPEVKENQTNGFIVTHRGGIVDNVIDGLEGGDLSRPSNEDHLFTQVADHNFSVDVVVLDDNNPDFVKSEGYRGILKLEIVDTSDATQSCENYPVISEGQMIGMDGIKSTYTLSYHHAHKSVAFRVRYLVDAFNRYVPFDSLTPTLGTMQRLFLHAFYQDRRCEMECMRRGDFKSCQECLYQRREEGGMAKLSCSRDTFTIKPKGVSIDLNASGLLKGGVLYRLDFNASLPEYEQHLDSSTGRLEARLKVPIGCALPASVQNLLPSSGLSFRDGMATLGGFSYPNVGDVNLSFVDFGWTSLDQNSSDANLSDCILGSSSNIPDSTGRVGCDIGSFKMVRFVPDRFENELTLNDFGGSGFVYLSNEEEMAAEISLKIKAMLHTGGVATNYTRGCFAKDINFSLALASVPEDWSSTEIASDAILFFDDANTTSDFGGHGGVFGSQSDLFRDGIAAVVTKVNFQRKKTEPLNPFYLRKSDLNITQVKDSSGVEGRDFDRSSDSAVPFYYGRVHVGDFATIDPYCRVPVSYETYCNECNKSRYTLAKGSESVDSVHWYVINSVHTDEEMGSYSEVRSVDETQIKAVALQALDLDVGNLPIPHQDKILLKPSSWLLYQRFATSRNWISFKIYFGSGAREWAGRGDLGKVIDARVSKKENEILDW